MKQANPLVTGVWKVFVLFSFAIFAAFPAAAAGQAGQVEDPTNILRSEEKILIEQTVREQAAPERLCVLLAREATLQTSLRLFREREGRCDVLAVYSSHDKKMRVAQHAGPEKRALEDDEIKKAVMTFEEYRREHPRKSPHDALQRAVEMLAQSLAREPRRQCSELKDGICDTACRGTDLDCLCGNGICEYFEQEACEADCGQKGWLCAVITDGACDEACLVRDIDCRLAAARERVTKAQEQSALRPETIIALLALAAIALCSLLIYVLHCRWKENRKAVSYLPSKMFLYLFTLIVLTIGMGLFFVVAERSATADTTAAPGAAYAAAVYRVLNAPACFARFDEETGAPEPGLIDVSLFTEHRLDECFMVPPDAAEKECLKLELHDYRLGEKKLLKEIQTKNFAQCAAVYPLQKEVFNVRLFENGQARPGLMIISAKKRE